MKRSVKIISILCAVLLVGVWAGTAALRFVMTRFITAEASYAGVSFERMLTRPDFIFAGKVLEIGDTRWNQNNGLPWMGDGALTYHTITCSVNHPIVGHVREGSARDKVVLAVIGNPEPGSDKRHVVLENDYSLNVGAEIVVFARQTELVWRKPDRMPMTMLMGYPAHSILIKGEDGSYRSPRDGPYTLDALAKQVQEKRSAQQGQHN
jgi:hypothetical protein